MRHLPEECIAKAVEYELTDKALEVQVGAVILSPGFEEFDARLKKEYGYGEYKNVVTSIEFERMLSATGPFFGTVMRPSDGEIPQEGRIHPMRRLQGREGGQSLLLLGLLHVRHQGSDHRRRAHRRV